MSGCVLRVSLAAKSDLDSVLQWFPLEPLAVFRAGQARTPRTKRVSECDGFNVLGSDHDGEHLREQVADAAAFLERHRDALARLRDSDALLSIDFGTAFSGDAMSRTHKLPHTLMRVCGELGVSIDIPVYRTGDSEG